ncbi:MAG: hypothetical protein J7L15_04835 [Clostridiales bacterium]|nr:hypothetical protein [Clostridiales bacterium]
MNWYKISQLESVKTVDQLREENPFQVGLDYNDAASRWLSKNTPRSYNISRRNNKDTEIELANETIENTVKPFIKSYVSDVLGKMVSFVNDVTRDMRRDVIDHLKDSKDVKKIGGIQAVQRVVDEISIFINSIIPQVEKIFSSDKIESISRVRGSDVSFELVLPDFAGIKRRVGYIKVPYKEIENISNYIHNTGFLSQSIQNTIREYVEEYGKQWQPDFSNLITNQSLGEKYRDVGIIKQEIKRVQKSMPQSTNNLEGIIDMLHIRERLPIPDLKDFVKSTLLESEDSVLQWRRGVAYPKGSIATTFKYIMPYMLRYKDKYPDFVVNTFFNIIKPHKDFHRGGVNSMARPRFVGEDKDNSLSGFNSYHDLYNSLSGNTLV